MRVTSRKTGASSSTTMRRFRSCRGGRSSGDPDGVRSGRWMIGTFGSGWSGASAMRYLTFYRPNRPVHDTGGAEDIRLLHRPFPLAVSTAAGLALRRFVNRRRAAANGRADERALLAADQAADARAGARAAADDHRGLAPRAVRLTPHRFARLRRHPAHRRGVYRSDHRARDHLVGIDRLPVDRLTVGRRLSVIHRR